MEIRVPCQHPEAPHPPAAAAPHSALGLREALSQGWWPRLGHPQGLLAARPRPVAEHSQWPEEGALGLPHAPYTEGTAGCPKPSVASTTGLLLRHRGLCCQGLCRSQETLGAPPTRASRTVVGDTFPASFSLSGKFRRSPQHVSGARMESGVRRRPRLGRCGTAHREPSGRPCHCYPQAARFALSCVFHTH